MRTVGLVSEDSDDRIELRLLSTATEMAQVVRVFQQVWGTNNPAVPRELLMAISHSGGYVSAAYEPGTERILGASVGLLARHRGAPALHSHITGLLAGVRRSGVGRTLKLHQRAWARERGIGTIVWTFDPLVRRNAWFNIAVLGAEVDEYLPDFYGPMTDTLNGTDATDRLLAAWAVDGELPITPRDGSELPAGVVRTGVVPTPNDIVTLRRTDAADASTWRTRVRTELTAALERGEHVVGFDSSGNYVLGRADA